MSEEFGVRGEEFGVANGKLRADGGELRLESNENYVVNSPSETPNSELRTPNSGRRERVRFRYAKTGDLRFIGHHDLAGCWERALRRAGVPVRFTEGFHPKPHLSSPLALGLGIEGLDEILEIDLTEPMDDDEIRRRLEPELDPGLTLTSISRPPKSDKTRVAWVEYESPLLDVPADDVHQAVARAERAESLPIERRLPGKPVKRLDLRPWLLGFSIVDDVLRFRVAVLPTGMARPDEVLAALGLERLLARGAVLRRTRVELEGPIAAGPSVGVVGETHHWPPDQQGAPA